METSQLREMEIIVFFNVGRKEKNGLRRVLMNISVNGELCVWWLQVRL